MDGMIIIDISMTVMWNWLGNTDGFYFRDDKTSKTSSKMLIW